MAEEKAAKVRNEEPALRVVRGGGEARPKAVGSRGGDVERAGREDKCCTEEGSRRGSITQVIAPSSCWRRESQARGEAVGEREETVERAAAVYQAGAGT